MTWMMIGESVIRNSNPWHLAYELYPLYLWLWAKATTTSWPNSSKILRDSRDSLPCRQKQVVWRGLKIPIKQANGTGSESHELLGKTSLRTTPVRHPMAMSRPPWSHEYLFEDIKVSRVSVILSAMKAKQTKTNQVIYKMFCKANHVIY